MVNPGNLSLLNSSNYSRQSGLFELSLPALETGAEANLTIFDPKEWWVFSRKNIYSRSQNTPFIGAELTGRVKGVITKSHYVTL
jgi:dihydroorotase